MCKRLVPIVPFLMAFVLWGVAAASGPAADNDPLLRAGEYYGQWHSDEARFTIDGLDDRGRFSGHVELLDGLYKGATFDVTGRLTADNGLIVKRTDCDQVSRAEAPRLVGAHYVWQGHTFIADTHARLRFELRARK